MPIVFVELFEGRTIDQKKKMVESITQAIVATGVSPEDVRVILKENPKHNWAIAGKLVSEE